MLNIYIYTRIYEYTHRHNPIKKAARKWIVKFRLADYAFEIMRL